MYNVIKDKEITKRKCGTSTMKEIEQLKRILASDLTDTRLAKIAGMSQQAISKYRNGLSKVENMRVEQALKLIKFQEELNMTLEERILKALSEMDEAIRNGLYDVYEESDGNLWFMDSGMEYSGDDKSAKEVAQVEDGEIINLY